MKKLIEVSDELLQAYERATPSINQELVRRYLAERTLALHHYEMLRRSFVNIVRAALVALVIAAPAAAWDRSKNPDQIPSIGFDFWKGQVAGMKKSDGGTNGGTVGFSLDYRHPLTNTFTLHAAGETEGINNNLQYTEGYRLKFGARVYFQN